MQEMAAALCFDPSKDGHSQQGQVPDNVENLMADKLVGKTEAGFVEHAFFGQDDGIIQRATADQTGLPQSLDFLDETERPCRSNVAGERSIVQRQAAVLPSNQRVLEVDQTINFKGVGRLETDSPRPHI